ncbi:NAD(P)H-binding protein, partial [Streptomyces sp. SID3343]|uniref:NAD(P)H-binding protein n=1 Tax=Streptomyces sp. SID3343 TaxID=2690260 RepID=UPI00136FD552
AAYLRAKGAADADVQGRSALDWTIVRPGRLTDDAGTGTVNLADATARGDVTRDDVAAVLAELLSEPGSAGRTLDLIGGSVPIPEAVKSIVG